jgi:hypothetical protein
VALEQDRPQQASKGRSFSLMHLDHDSPSGIFLGTTMLSSFLEFGWYLLRGGTTMFPLVPIVAWRGGAGGSMTRPRK